MPNASPAPRDAGRVVRQIPTRRGSRLQPSWVNEGAHVERFDQIAGYLRNRSVLDVGCASGWRRDDWMHGMIASVAREVVGVDVDAEAAAEINSAGHQVFVADASSIRLSRTFDVVHAGELIEHLDDPGSFLDRARLHMRDDSELLLTTPNPFCVTNFLYRLGGPARVNRDHVCWFCEDTLRQLLGRHGFEVAESRYLTHRAPGLLRQLIGRALRGALPDRLAWNTLFVVARPARERESDAAEM